MNVFPWENGTIVEGAYVQINGTKYYLQDGTISGGTPVTAGNLITMQNIINQNIVDYFKSKSKILWKNDYPTTSFVGQTINLAQSLSNYDYYEILFIQSTTAQRVMSTGKIPVGYGTILHWNANTDYYRATEASVSGSSITFEDGKAGSSTSNTNTIPFMVIGYNLGIEEA